MSLTAIKNRQRTPVDSTPGPSAAAPLIGEPLRELVERYQQHLADERRLSPETVRAYLTNVREWLRFVAEKRGPEVLVRDLDLLVGSPVDWLGFYAAKLTETAVNSSWMVALMVVPMLAAYGVVFHGGPLFPVVALAALLPYVLLPAIVGSAVTLILVNVFPARRTRDLPASLSNSEQRTDERANHRVAERIRLHLGGQHPIGIARPLEPS